MKQMMVEIAMESPLYPGIPLRERLALINAMIARKSAGSEGGHASGQILRNDLLNWVRSGKFRTT